jgi:hypothetical protein
MVDLPLETAVFYEKVSQQGGYKIEQVLADALFKMAGDLSVELLAQKRRRQKRGS